MSRWMRARRAGVLALLAAHASAQTLPDAGRLLQAQERAPLPTRAPAPALVLPAEPNAPVAAGVAVRVAGFRFRRNRAIGDAELNAALADLVGTELALNGLQGAAARVTALYRRRGYALARAYLPTQQIADGVVEIEVLEGTLGALRLDNQSLVDDAPVRALLAGVRAGEPLTEAALERALLLVNALPGVAVQSTLTPGASVGTSDLDVRVRGGRRLAGEVTLDDYGNRYSGAWRAGTLLSVNSPLGLGDTLGLRASVSDAAFRYARLAYQLPLGGDGWQLGGAASSMRYRLGAEFAALQAHGTAAIASLYALYPLRRSRALNLTLQLDAERKRLVDSSDATGARADKALSLLTLGLSGEALDGAGDGASSASASLVGGTLARDGAAGQRYHKLALQLARQQRLAVLGPAWRLDAQASVQLAGSELDSSEKLSLGGVQGVRAYPQGEAACDDAAVASATLSVALAPAWQLSGFVDGAAGRLTHGAPADAPRNRQRLAGAGLGLAYARAGGVRVTAQLAWRGGATPLSEPDRRPRFWSAVQTVF